MGLVSRLGFRGRLIAAMISLVALVSLVSCGLVGLLLRCTGRPLADAFG